jgi:hypothetical protein
MMSSVPLAFALLAVSVAAAAAAEPDGSGDYDFNVTTFEKKPFEIGGYVEAEWQHFDLNREGAFFRLNRSPKLHNEHNDQIQGTLHLEGAYRSGMATVRGTGEIAGTKDRFGDDRDATLLEGLVAVQTDPGITLELGKKSLKWGKGYAWNPVGFVELAKNPDDPSEAREGFAMVTGDLIASFEGPVKTVAFTPVVLPVVGGVNGSFGSAKKGTNVAAKLYLLAWDTDIDLMALTGASKTDRFGFDVSRNLTSNFEIHGEWAYITDNQRTVARSDGPNQKVIGNAINWLFGIRYLTKTDVTIIAEYYHQATGYTRSEMDGFFDLAHLAIDTGTSTLHSRATSARDAGYGRPTPGRDYLYFRVSQKEPFDLLHWTPAATVLANARDRSFSVTPELQYTGIDDLELRVRCGYLHGGSQEEFGEKQNDFKVELRARYHF